MCRSQASVLYSYLCSFIFAQCFSFASYGGPNQRIPLVHYQQTRFKKMLSTRTHVKESHQYHVPVLRYQDTVKNCVTETCLWDNKLTACHQYNLLAAFTASDSLTLIRVDCLQIHDVADDVVLVRDAIAPQHVTSLSGNVQRLATAVPLQHGDHLRGCSRKHEAEEAKSTN